MNASRYTAITGRGVHRLFPGLHIDEPVLRLEVDEAEGPVILCEPDRPFASLLVANGDRYHGGIHPEPGTPTDCLVVLGGGAPGFMWEPPFAGVPKRCLVLAGNRSASIRIPGDIEHRQVVIAHDLHLERLEVSRRMGRLTIWQAPRLHVIHGQGRELDVRHLGGQAPRWLVLNHEWSVIEGWPDAHRVLYRMLPAWEESSSRIQVLADRHPAVTPALTAWVAGEGGTQVREAWLAWVLATVDWKRALDSLRPADIGLARRMWTLTEDLLHHIDLGILFDRDYSRCLQAVDGERVRRNRRWKRLIFLDPEWAPTVLACWEACAHRIPVPPPLPMAGEDLLCHLAPWAVAMQERFSATLRNGFMDLLVRLEGCLPVCENGIPGHAPSRYEDTVLSLPMLVAFLVGIGERNAADRLVVWLGSRDAPRRREVKLALEVGRQLCLPGADATLAHLTKHEDPQIQHWAVATLLSDENPFPEGVCA